MEKDMEKIIVLSVLNAKYIHASPAPWCLKSGVKKYAPELYNNIKIIECNINQPTEDILEKIIAMSPAIVGFSCYIWNINQTLALCNKLKQNLPNVIIVLGGPEVSYCARDIIKNNLQIDYILTGEGEESFPDFLKAIIFNDINKPMPEQIYKEIPGICGRDVSNNIYQIEAVAPKKKIPSPLLSGYSDAIHNRIAYFETSRGCPYSCAFCLSGSCDKPRYFNLDTVFPDLIRLANSGAQIIKFVDRTFNANPSHANKILQFILNSYGKEIPKGVCFHFEIAGDILKEETFVLLEQMPIGAVQLEIGIQSFNEKTLAAINRKTNTQVLQTNIQRLIAMGNMHIHIDLIAGLPHEDLNSFINSFNRAYNLKAQMLQLGFLKLLHGSEMRNNPQTFPCDFDKNAPYQVQSTPYLSVEDIRLLHLAEDAINKVYNSGRFHLTIDYVLNTSGISPFEFYSEFAKKTGHGHGVSLDDYTAILQEFCATLPYVEREILRDLLIRDRLSTNPSGRIPKCLYRQDSRMEKVIKWLSNNPDTKPQKGLRRGIAILNSTNTVCWVDYDVNMKNPVTRRWILNEIPLNMILN